MGVPYLNKHTLSPTEDQSLSIRHIG